MNRASKEYYKKANEYKPEALLKMSQKHMRKMFNFIFFTITLTLLSVTNAQNIGVWNNYADMKMVTDIQSTDEGFWTATSGGATYYSDNVENFELFLP